MKVENLSKTYRAKGAPPVQALKNVSFSLPEKGMVFLLGRSGSGKSTLLHILSELENFDEGDIVYRGSRFSAFSERDRDKYRNNCCGIIFQDYSLITELTVGENIALALRLQGERDTDARVRRALDQVGLSGCEKRRVTQLSGGQKQRVAIARALVKSPRILFADEPTGALDEQTGRDILMLLKQLSKEQLVFVVSHDRAFAETFGDRIIELSDGSIVSDSAPAAHEEAPEPLPDLPARLPLATALKRSDFQDACMYAALLQNLCLSLCAVFLIFAFLLLINFISASVHDKLQQMGILSALGAGFRENVKIYTGSALRIGAALFLLSSAFMPLYVSLANAFIAPYVPAAPALLAVTFWPFAAVFAIALAATFLGSFLAMLRYRRRAPAEIIRMGQS